MLSKIGGLFKGGAKLAHRKVLAPSWKRLLEDKSPILKLGETVADYTVGYPMHYAERAGDYLFGRALAGVTYAGSGVAKGAGFIGTKVLLDESGKIGQHLWKNRYQYGAAAGTAIVAGAIQRNMPDPTYHTPIRVHNITGRSSSDIGFSNHTLNSYYAR